LRRQSIVKQPGTRLWLCALSLLAAALPSLSQQQQQQSAAPTFSSNVKVVNVLTSVRDKHGQIVNNLTKDDFVLEEDGHPQVVHGCHWALACVNFDDCPHNPTCETPISPFSIA